MINMMLQNQVAILKRHLARYAAILGDIQDWYEANKKPMPPEVYLAIFKKHK